MEETDRQRLREVQGLVSVSQRLLQEPFGVGVFLILSPL